MVIARARPDSFEAPKAPTQQKQESRKLAKLVYGWFSKCRYESDGASSDSSSSSSSSSSDVILLYSSGHERTGARLARPLRQLGPREGSCSRSPASSSG
eukprot:8608512-Heterocapsa_arctica.AAC.1